MCIEKYLSSATHPNQGFVALGGATAHSTTQLQSLSPNSNIFLIELGMDDNFHLFI